MKKFSIILSVFSFFAISSQLKAQTFSVSAYGGYTFQDKVDFGNAYAQIKDGAMWGVSVEGIGPIGMAKALELLYQYQSTTIPVYSRSNGVINPLNTSDNTGVVSYLLINGTQYFPVNPKIMPYFGAGGGVGFISVNGGNGSSTGFALGFKDRCENKSR